MKINLINPPNTRLSAQQQILVNRGIKETEIHHYMNLTGADVNDPSIFGEDLMYKAATILL